MEALVQSQYEKVVDADRRRDHFVEPWGEFGNNLVPTAVSQSVSWRGNTAQIERKDDDAEAVET
jgi:hypothetical protein